MRAAVLLFFLASSAFADCVTSTKLSCGTTVIASLEPGCRNQYTFNGTFQQVAGATVRPLDASLTRPRITLAAPGGYPTPSVTGGGTATLNFVLPSNGTYTYTVTSADAPARGSYLFALGCRAANPFAPFACVRQELVDGETFEWDVTSVGCTFTDPDRYASAFPVYGVAGDPIHLRLESEFAPRIAIYSFDFLTPILTADQPEVTFVPADTARYWVMATTTLRGAQGHFKLSMSARESGCVAPVVIHDQDDVTVPSSAQTTLSADVSATTRDLLWEWQDMRALPTIISNDAQLTTPPVTSKQYYAARITNPCGATMTRLITVSPREERRRPAR